ncbi:MAG: hypothetical protein ACXWYB_08685 [Aeromicrobium sp.]
MPPVISSSGSVPNCASRKPAESLIASASSGPVAMSAPPATVSVASMFELPAPSQMHYNWAVTRLDAIDLDEMREVVLDAWQMVVPKRLVRTFLRGE